MGYWISREGRVYDNRDHYEFVKAHPKRFGFSAAEVKGFGGAERQGVLDEVIRRGWIRVRGDARQGLAFEIRKFDGDTLFNIAEFLRRSKWDPNAMVLVDDGQRSIYEPVTYFTEGAALSAVANPRRRKRKEG